MTTKQSIIEQLYSALLNEECGYTVNLEGNVPQTGYVVGITDYSYPRSFLIDIESYGSQIDFDVFRVLVGWMIDKHPGGDEWDDSRKTVGFWIENGTVYLDCGLIITDQDDAVRLGFEYQQKAIYDLDRQETVYLTPEAERNAEQ
jgi:hypothetical protein